MRKDCIKKFHYSPYKKKDIKTNMMNINMHDVRKISQKEKLDHEGRFSS